MVKNFTQRQRESGVYNFRERGRERTEKGRVTDKRGKEKDCGWGRVRDVRERERDRKKRVAVNEGVKEWKNDND